VNIFCNRMYVILRVWCSHKILAHTHFSHFNSIISCSSTPVIRQNNGSEEEKAP
jgi:hypothetical protein